MQRKVCLQCKKSYTKKINCSQKSWESSSFCSSKCYFDSKRGKPSWNKGIKGVCKSNKGSFKKGIIPWNKGLKGYMAGSLNNKWKGDENITYSSKHTYLTRRNKHPKECEFCGKIGRKKNGRWTIEWAKKHGHEYTVDTRDYLKLCHKCHCHYDKHILT